MDPIKNHLGKDDFNDPVTRSFINEEEKNRIFILRKSSKG